MSEVCRATDAHLKRAVVRRATLVGLAITIGAVAFGFRLLAVRSLTNDHYMHLAWAQQVLLGGIPGRDFVDPGMPLMFTLSAAVQWFSPGPYSEAVLTCAILALTAVVTFLVTVDLTESLLAGTLAALVEIALMTRLYSYPKVLVPAVVLLLFQRYVRHPGRAAITALGAWTALAVLLRHDLGVYAAAGIGAGVLTAHRPVWHDGLRALRWYVAVVLSLMLPYVVFVEWTEGIVEHIHEASEFARGESYQLLPKLPAFEFLHYPTRIAAWSALDSAALLYCVAYLLPPVALVLLLTRRQRNAGRYAVLIVGLVLLSFYLLIILRHPIQSRIQDLASLLAIMGAWAAVETGRHACGLARAGSLFARTTGATLLAVVSVIVAVAVGSVWKLGDLTGNVADTHVARGFDAVERTIQGVKHNGTTWPWDRFWPAGAMPDAIRYINRCTTPGDAVLLTWAAPEYYYFSRRRFAAGHALFLPPDAFTTQHDQERMLARLRNDRVPIALINESRRTEFVEAYAKVDEYLRMEYVATGHFDIRDGSTIVVAVQRGLEAKSAYGPDGWPCDLTNQQPRRTDGLVPQPMESRVERPDRRTERLHPTNDRDQ